MADPLLKKLQHRGDVPVLVLWAPPEVEPALQAWEDAGVTVHRRMRGGSPFVLAFLRSRADIEQRAGRLASLLGGDDPVLWLAYPKEASKRYRSDVGRDDSWEPIGDLGFEPVRQVAIDADWSALRFRRTERIATLTRSRALSGSGRRRSAGAPAAAAPDPPEVEAWLEALPEPRRQTLRTVHDVVRREAPELEPSVQGKAVGYGPFHYVYDSGREGDSHRLLLANNARYVSLYVLAGDEGGYLAEQRAPELGKVSVGRSCVRFAKAEDLDLDALAALVRDAAAQHAAESSA